jgi:hypothetical protein
MSSLLISPGLRGVGPGVLQVRSLANRGGGVCRAGGTPVPVAVAHVAGEAAVSAPADLDALAAELAALERRLSDFEARFALA